MIYKKIFQYDYLKLSYECLDYEVLNYIDKINRKHQIIEHRLTGYRSHYFSLFYSVDINFISKTFFNNEMNDFEDIKITAKLYFNNEEDKIIRFLNNNMKTIIEKMEESEELRKLCFENLGVSEYLNNCLDIDNKEEMKKKVDISVIRSFIYNNKPNAFRTLFSGAGSVFIAEKIEEVEKTIEDLEFFSCLNDNNLRNRIYKIKEKQFGIKEYGKNWLAII